MKNDNASSGGFLVVDCSFILGAKSTVNHAKYHF